MHRFKINIEMNVQYPSDTRYKANAFNGTFTRFSRLLKTRLVLRLNAFSEAFERV